jgi:hypothetical protein
MKLQGSDPEKHLRAVDISLATREPFVFTRFSDGELFMLMEKEIRLTPNGAWIDGVQVNCQKYLHHDCKTFIPGRDKDIISQLRNAYSHIRENYIVGLPYSCCVGEDLFAHLKSMLGIPKMHTTANLLINANYPAFLRRTLKILQTRRLLIVANKRAITRILGSAVESHVELGDDCGSEIEWYYEKLHESIRMVGAIDLVVLCSASYLSNIFGHRLARYWPEVTFMDIGTAIHPHMGLGLIREYLVEYWKSPESYLGHTCLCRV